MRLVARPPVRDQPAPTRSSTGPSTSPAAAASFKRNRLEQIFRDVRMGRFHPGNTLLAHELIGKLCLGIDPDDAHAGAERDGIDPRPDHGSGRGSSALASLDYIDHHRFKAMLSSRQRGARRAGGPSMYDSKNPIHLQVKEHYAAAAKIAESGPARAAGPTKPNGVRTLRR